MSSPTSHVRRPAVLAALVALAVCAGCAGPPGSDASSTVADTLPPTTSSTTSTTPPVTTTTTTKPKPRPTTKKPAPHTTTTSQRPKPVVRTSTAAPAPRRTTPPAAPVAATCSVPSGVTAPQVVLVIASGSSATVRACARSGSRYLLQLGPYAGHVGRNGVSWSKREGDNTTPGGTYALVEGFGNYSNPGLRVGSWLGVDANDVWVEDPKSALYNTHQRLPSNGRFGYAEPMNSAPAYNYAQVIAYNTANTPGKGSGIFFHVDQGRGTAGCVSLPVSSLLSVMRWERSGVVMSIR